MCICGGVATVGLSFQAGAQVALVDGIGLVYLALIYALERDLPRLA